MKAGTRIELRTDVRLPSGRIVGKGALGWVAEPPNNNVFDGCFNPRPRERPHKITLDDFDGAYEVVLAQIAEVE